MKRNKDWFIEEIARRAGFTKGDVSIILDTIEKIFKDIVLNNDVLLVRSFGKLYTQVIPPRKGSKGQMLPASTRVIFKLAEPIRYADREEYSEMT